MSIEADYLSILQGAENMPLGKKEALFLLENTRDRESAELLFATARRVREKAKGNTFKLTGGIATVLACNLRPLCTYCPYWREKDKKPLSTEEILKGVAYLTEYGIRDFHLSGGTTLGSDGRDILGIVKSIREAGFEDVEIDINCGAAMSLSTLLELKQYNVKMVRSVFETLNPEVFRVMKPGDNLEEKKRFAWLIGEAGIALGTGILAGISPQETQYEDYVNFLFEVKEFPHLQSLYVSKFYPFDTIPLKGYLPCSDLDAAKVIAVARLILPNIDIGGAQGWGSAQEYSPFQAGGGNSALGIHINRTPAYLNVTNQGANTIYKENMEYRNHVALVEHFYKEQGIRLVR